MQREYIPLLLAGLFILTPTVVSGQAPAAVAPAKKLAPGVLTVIPPAPQERETASLPVELSDIIQGKPALNWNPNYTPETRTIYSRARNIILRREIWNLEFAFKPLRMILVDVPQPSGKMRRKRIWYMVYRVKYYGKELHPEEEKDQYQTTRYKVQQREYAYRWFIPQFVLTSHDLNKSYLDRVIPAAREPIQLRETPGRRLLNSVEISGQKILLSTSRVDRSVWGVVTWEDVDPRIDYFSIYIQGLTNAYRFQESTSVKPGDPPGSGRKLAQKTLVLNFWRPGDSVLEHEEEIRYGVPIKTDPALQKKMLQIYGVDERLDYLWIYR